MIKNKVSNKKYHNLIRIHIKECIGWFAESKVGDITEQITKGSYGDITLTAIWVEE